MTPRISHAAFLSLLVVSCVQPTLTKTNSPPAVSINEPGSDARFGEGETVRMSAKVVDDGATDDLLVGWFSNGTPLVADLVPDSEGIVSFTTADLDLGPHALTVRAADIENATGEASVNIEVLEIDNDPTLTIIRPESGDVGQEGLEFLFEAEVSDPQDANEDLEVTISSDLAGDLCIEQADANGTILCRPVMQVAGQHRIVFTVRDLDGNSAIRSTILEVEAVSEEPVVQVVHPAAGERPRITDPYAFEATVSDNQDLPGSLLVSLDSSVDGFICGMSVDANGTASCAALLTTPGAHQLTFTVTDTDGNEGTAIVVTQVSDGTDVDDDGDGFAENQGDCDDSDGSVYPGATELPNTVDDNCNGTADENTVLVDDDSDGYCESQSIPCTDGAQLGDCDDGNIFLNPGAIEVCGDGLDNNCNGQQDEIGAQGCTTFYFDGDIDGFGDPNNSVCRCSASGPYTALSGTDCDDTRANVNPSAPEIPDGIDNDCNGATDEGTNRVDDDGDGFCESQGAPCSDGSTLGDCNDSDAGINPNATEVCGDSIDNNCNNLTDEAGAQGCSTFYADNDNDGFGDPDQSACLCAPSPTFPATNSSDCNDTSILTNPNGSEAPDGVDNDCDGTIDEGTALFDDDGDGFCESPTGPCSDGTAIGDCDDSTSLIGPNAQEVCGNGIDDDCDRQQNEPDSLGCQQVYTDDDGDGFGDPDDSACLCSPMAPYVVLNGNDCDDNDAQVGPGGGEIADGLDNDCDGIIDEGTALYDDDGDGYCESQGLACSDGSQQGDCDDGTIMVNPGAEEVCGNGIDDNCSGQQDEPNAIGCSDVFADRDNDGFGDGNDSQCACGFRGVYDVANGDDCDDNNGSANPNASEIPDGVDNNCNGSIDEGTVRSDDDGDGFCEGTQGGCSDGSSPGDCNDSNVDVNPAASEICNNGVDDNCSGTQNTNNAIGCVDYYRDSDGDGYGNPNSTVCACNSQGPFTTDNTDCDDSQASVNPAAVERPDGRDNNCNGQFDEGTNRVDNDGDGYCGSTTCTAQPGQAAPNPGDCNDTNAAINPGATEVCGNGLDDNCDGQFNEGQNPIGGRVYYPDNDNDGFGAGSGRNYCGPTGTFRSTNNNDCYDSNANAKPGQSQYFASHRGDNSYDYDCSGSTTRRWTGTYDCECQVSIAGFPVVLIDFDDGWASDPGCGGTGTWYNSCRYQSAQVDIFGICNPLGPEIASTVTRTQQCR